MSALRPAGVLLFLATFGCIGDPVVVDIPDPRPLADADLSPGIHRESVVLGGGLLLYTVAVPPLPDTAEVPLVLALHYAGAQTPYYGEEYLRLLPEPALRDLGAIIVAPDAPNSEWASTNSETALLLFLNAALDAWPVDPDRVIVTGYSMGGIGTWLMAARNPERFSAALPMAAPAPLDLTLDIPVYAIHGSADELFGVEQAVAAVDSMQARGQPVELTVVDSLGHYEAQNYVDALRDAVPWINQVWNDE